MQKNENYSLHIRSYYNETISQWQKKLHEVYKGKKLNNTVLNNECVTEPKEEIRQFIESNDNSITTY